MKYLIRFNESIDEIEKFSRDSLAYLLDEGFEFKKISSDRDHYICFCLYKVDPKRISPTLVDKNTNGFYWDDIKDDFIPFLELFNEKFPYGKSSIKSIGFNTKNRFDDTYIERQIPIKGKSFEDILNDTLNFGVWLDNIQLTLYKYNDRNSNK
jgi:hypothetical protein